MPAIPNLFAETPEVLPEELCHLLVSADDVRIERIVSRGHASAPGFWYDQQQDEFVVLLSGAAELEFEDRRVRLQPGDYINIAAHVRHRVAWTSPDADTIWLAVHYERRNANED